MGQSGQGSVGIGAGMEKVLFESPFPTLQSPFPSPALPPSPSGAVGRGHGRYKDSAHRGRRSLPLPSLPLPALQLPALTRGARPGRGKEPSTLP